VISRPIQVALSGSGFLLPVHVGALQAIEGAGYAISALSGTSGGAIVAAIYAVQQDAQKLADLVLATDWRPFTRGMHKKTDETPKISTGVNKGHGLLPHGDGPTLGGLIGHEEKSIMGWIYNGSLRCWARVRPFPYTNRLTNWTMPLLVKHTNTTRMGFAPVDAPYTTNYEYPEMKSGTVDEGACVTRRITVSPTLASFSIVLASSVMAILC
jgi:hypothetical protein